MNLLKGFEIRHIRWLLIGDVVLMLANILYYAFDKPFWTVSRLVYLGSDGGIAAWYSSILLAVAALAAAHCHRIARLRNMDRAWTFLVLSALLWLMSCDEIAMFHEIIGELIAEKANFRNEAFAANAPWVWTLGPVIIALFVGVAALAWKIVAQVRRAGLFLALGFGVIVVGGIFLESSINFLNHEKLQWLWRVEIIVEETLEMIGTLLIAASLVMWKDVSTQAVSGR